jgi:RNA polymerase sigma-70 factor (ECF subfamily)
MGNETEGLLRAARLGDPRAFSALAEPYRRELLLYSYRLLGSLHDAEDLTQECFLRAWTKVATFEGRASFRAWLYRIATHLAFDTIDKRQRRPAPQQLASPMGSADPSQGFEAEPPWLEPLPDTLLVDEAGEPEKRYLRRESVTLAFLVVLQALPPRQRAVLLLRDVLEWHAGEVSDLLDMSPVAVESALHRARATLAQRREALASATLFPATADSATQAILQRYVHAWEEADIERLVALLREDATLSMPPLADRYVGRTAIAAFYGSLLKESAWRLIPVGANAQPGYVSYRWESDGLYHATSVSVLTVADDLIVALTCFLDPGLCRTFGLPSTLGSAGNP